jgi:hypothetical protein
LQQGKVRPGVPGKSYIAAMVAHNPSQVAFAEDVKFVENTVPMKPGDGLWKT